MADILEIEDSTALAVEQKQEPQPEPEVKQEEAKDSVVDEFPEKYKGKSVADVVRMHQEAESALSRQGQDMGELRKLADELLKSQFKKEPEVEQPKEVDFFENPQEAIRRAVETNPKVQQAEQYALQAHKAAVLQQLASEFPDFQQVVQDGAFVDWVKSSKKRIQMIQEANDFDLDSARELLGTWKQLRQATKPALPAEEVKAREMALKAASVDAGGSSESTKKSFRRADLIRMKMNDPARYAAMNDEIMLAYQEGRVK